MSVDPDSYGVAKALVCDFMNKFGSSPAEAAEYFGQGATLFYQGTQTQGRDNIRQFLESKGRLSLTVNGWEVQTVPGSDLWSMVIAIGSVIDLSSGQSASFHSAFYVESIRSEHRGFIRYQAFNYF